MAPWRTPLTSSQHSVKPLGRRTRFREPWKRARARAHSLEGPKVCSSFHSSPSRQTDSKARLKSTKQHQTGREGLAARRSVSQKVQACSSPPQRKPAWVGARSLLASGRSLRKRRHSSTFAAQGRSEIGLQFSKTQERPGLGMGTTCPSLKKEGTTPCRRQALQSARKKRVQQGSREARGL